MRRLVKTYLTNMLIAVTVRFLLIAFHDLVSPYIWRASSGQRGSGLNVPFRNPCRTPSAPVAMLFRPPVGLDDDDAEDVGNSDDFPPTPAV